MNVFKSDNSRSFAAAVATALKSVSDVKCTMVEILPDIDADATVRTAVELLKKAGKWVDGDAVDSPASFGLNSFSVRSIVTAITRCNGQFASNHSSVSDLLFKTSNDIKKNLVDKERGTSFADGIAVGKNNRYSAGDGGSSNSNLSNADAAASTAAVVYTPLETSTVSSPTGVAVVHAAVDYAKAWSIITDSRRIVADKFDELAAYLQEQGIVEAEDLEVQDDDVIAMIRGFLNPTGQQLFARAMGKQI